MFLSNLWKLQDLSSLCLGSAVCGLVKLEEVCVSAPSGSGARSTIVAETTMG